MERANQCALVRSSVAAATNVSNAHAYQASHWLRTLAQVAYACLARTRAGMHDDFTTPTPTTRICCQATDLQAESSLQTA
jgi:hypothetical protein